VTLLKSGIMRQETDPRDLHPEVRRILNILKVVDSVGMDIDGFLFDLDSVVVQKFNRIYGTNYTPDDITEWNSVRDLLIEQGHSLEEAEYLQNEDYWDNPKVIKRAPLIRGARELTLALLRTGKEIYPTTSRKPNLAEATNWQLRFWLGWIPEDNLRIRDDGDFDRHGFKARTILSDRFGMFFENYPPHGELILDTTDAHLVICPYKARFEQQYPKVASNPRVIKLPNLSMLGEAIF